MPIKCTYTRRAIKREPWDHGSSDKSDVRIITTHEGFILMCEKVWEKAVNLIENLDWYEENDILLPKPKDLLGLKYYDYYDRKKVTERFSFFCDRENYVCFGWDQILWSSESFREHKLVKDALKQIGEIGIPWQFMRCGRDYDDIEREESDNFYDSGLPGLVLNIAISY